MRTIILITLVSWATHVRSQVQSSIESNANAATLEVKNLNELSGSWIDFKNDVNQSMLIGLSGNNTSFFPPFTANTGFINTTANNSELFIGTEGESAIHIDSDQEVGIGTSNPFYPLDINGDTRVMNGNLILEGSLSHLQIDSGNVLIDEGGFYMGPYISSTAPSVRKFDVLIVDEKGGLFEVNAPNSIYDGFYFKSNHEKNAPYYSSTVNIENSSSGRGLSVASETGKAIVAFSKNDENTLEIVNSNDSTGMAASFRNINTNNTEAVIKIDHSNFNSNALWVSRGKTKLEGATEITSSLKVGSFDNYNLDLCRTFDGTLANCSSSKRFKHNIVSMSDGLSVLKKLRPVSFVWNQTEEKDIGFIAKEVAEVDNRLTTYNKDGQIQGVKYKLITTYLVNAINAQQATIQNQAKEIEALSARVEALSK